MHKVAKGRKSHVYDVDDGMVNGAEWLQVRATVKDHLLRSPSICTDISKSVTTSIGCVPVIF